MTAGGGLFQLFVSSGLRVRRCFICVGLSPLIYLKCFYGGWVAGRGVEQLGFLLAKLLTILLTSYGRHIRGVRGGPTIGVSAMLSTSGRATLRFPKQIGTTRSVDLTFQIDKAVRHVCIGSNTCIHGKRLLTRLSPASCRVRLSTTRTRCRHIGTRTRHMVTLCGRGMAAPSTGSGTICKLERVATGCGRTGSRLRCAHLCTPFDKCMRGHLFSSRRAITTKVPIISMVDRKAPRIRVGLPTIRCVHHQRFAHCCYAFSMCPRRECILSLVDIAPGTGTGRLCAVHLRLGDKSGRTIPSPKVGAVIAVRYTRKRVHGLSIPNKTVLHRGKGANIFLCGPSSGAVHHYSIAIAHLLDSNEYLVASSRIGPNSLVIISKIRRIGSKRRIRPLLPTTRAGIKKLL